MKVLFITQWYLPINSAAARRAERIARWFITKKYDLTILTGFPSYPTGILPARYKWKLWAREKDGKVDIFRTYEYPAPNKGLVKRLINNFSFMLSAMAAVLLLPSFDAVVVTSPPFLSGIPGLLAKKIWKSKFVFDIRDLWPDSMIEMGVLKKPGMIRVGEKLEQSYYRNADNITVVSPKIKKHLVSEGVTEKKIKVLTNSVDSDFFKPKKIDRKKYGLRNKDFIVCFVGNHSRVYDLKNVLKATTILQKNAQIKMLFVGEGEDRQDLINLSERLGLKNVFFVGEKNAHQVVEYINISNVGLISLANLPIFQDSYPAKTSEYLACGKPVIASIGGDIKKILLENEVGLVYPSGNPIKLAEVILELANDPKLCQIMSKNARKLALEKFSDKGFFETLDQLF